MSIAQNESTMYSLRDLYPVMRASDNTVDDTVLDEADQQALDIAAPEIATNGKQKGNMTKWLLIGFGVFVLFHIGRTD